MEKRIADVFLILLVTVPGDGDCDGGEHVLPYLLDPLPGDVSVGVGAAHQELPSLTTHCDKTGFL